MDGEMMYVPGLSTGGSRPSLGRRAAHPGPSAERDLYSETRHVAFIQEGFTGRIPAKRNVCFVSFILCVSLTSTGSGQRAPD